MNTLRIKFILIFLAFKIICVAQNNENDTNKVKAINLIVLKLSRNNPDSSLLLSQEGLLISNSIHSKDGKKFTLQSLINIADSYWNKGNLPKALDYNLKALKISEEIGDKKMLARCYENIGYINLYQSDFSKALEYSFKALKINEAINNKEAIGSVYGLIGGIYLYQLDYSKSIEYILKNIQIAEEIGSEYDLAVSYSRISQSYILSGNLLKGLEYSSKSLKKRKNLKDKKGMADCYITMGYTHNKLKNFKLALSYIDSALYLTNEINDLANEQMAYKTLSSIYGNMGMYKEAFNSHIKFKELTDSIYNINTNKQQADLNTKFEVDKKEAELILKSNAEKEKLQAIALEEKKQKNVIIFSVGGLLFLVIIFLMVLSSRFRVINKQKTIIEAKNKEVMDSITYAKRIQTSLLPSEKYIEKSMARLRG